MSAAASTLPVRLRPSLPHAVVALAAVTVVAGLAITALAPPRAFGSWLGTSYPPFFAFWLPRVSVWVLPAVLALGAGVAGAPALVRRASLGWFGAGILALGLGERLLLAAARVGPHAWVAPISTQDSAANEYLYGLPAVHGLGVTTFLDRFAQLDTTLPLHATAHPPGLLVSFELLGLRTPSAVAAFFVLGGALATPLVYLVGRRLVADETARVAALLFCLSPSALLFGATSADALFVTLALAAALALLAESRAWRVAGALVLLPLAAFFSYSLLAVGAVVVLAVGWRDGPRTALALAVMCAAGLVVAYSTLFAATGFDPFGALAAANEAYRGGIDPARPYLFWLFGSPVAWLVSLGLPIAWCALRALERRDLVARALAVTVVVASVLGFAKAETERIWLFLVPFACLAAASVLPRHRLSLVLGLLAAQALAVELLLFTIW